ncbi:MAG: acetate--CoA ligase family protein [Deltaproteobacteria bacterium]|nr:acetate--CoA ligase family protein [Deltaproteobacteria bacterium]
MHDTPLNEVEVYALLARVGLVPPRHSWLGDALDLEPGSPVVLKGIAEGVWHKSELGAVAMLPFEHDALEAAADAMRLRLEAAGHRWIGALVCERVSFARVDGLPSEAIVSVMRRQGIWTVLMGLGGLQAEVWSELAPPLLWPVRWVSPEAALRELEGHLLGRVWLGAVRAGRPLTTRPELLDLLERLWRTTDEAERAGLALVEINPLVLDDQGHPRPLDGVGQRASSASEAAPPRGPPPPFLDALIAPRTIAVQGVSRRADSPGHVILDNLRRASLAQDGAGLFVVGASHTIEGVVALDDLAALVARPVDLLVVALPAEAALEALERLIEQGGGATAVALVAGGLGDGADDRGLGLRARRLLSEARAAGRWTPAVLGPNCLGHVVPALGLDSTFIPPDRWRAPGAIGGPHRLALVSQSGAFMLTRLARDPALPLAFALTLGNQLDVGLADVLAALADRASEAASTPRAVAAYVEGLGGADLGPLVEAARRLVASGCAVLLYRAGRTEAGRRAASSHTGAVAGDLELERAALRRVGVRLADSVAGFDAAITWLARYPALAPGPVAVVSNAGFETVNAADRLGAAFTSARLAPEARAELVALLARHHLGGLVTPELPLDLTPMATLACYEEVLSLLVQGPAPIVIASLVPFSGRLDLAALPALAARLARDFRARGKALALVVDSGPDHEALRRALGACDLPVFARLEDALTGLAALA